MQDHQELQMLDKLIADLGGDENPSHTQGPCRLLGEHLGTARRNLLGAMVGEYELALHQALESIGCIPQKNDRTNAKVTLQHLMKLRILRSPYRQQT
jgi:hypothetical protein